MLCIGRSKIGYGKKKKPNFIYVLKGENSCRKAYVDI